MRYFAALVLLFPTSLVASDGGGHTYSVGQVYKQHHSLAGKVIRVRGWLDHCQALSCEISESKSAERRFLSIGGSPSFDRIARRYRGEFIEIQATLDPECLHARADGPKSSSSASGEESGEFVVCTDRAAELANPKFIRVIK